MYTIMYTKLYTLSKGGSYMSTTVRISDNSLQTLRKIATQASEPIQIILDKAIESYRREYFLKKANLAFEILKNNNEAWQDEISERETWDCTMKDGSRGNEKW